MNVLTSQKLVSHNEFDLIVSTKEFNSRVARINYSLSNLSNIQPFLTKSLLQVLSKAAIVQHDKIQRTCITEKEKRFTNWMSSRLTGHMAPRWCALLKLNL